MNELTDPHDPLAILAGTLCRRLAMQWEDRLPIEGLAHGSPPLH
jgi:hypothetical protein